MDRTINLVNVGPIESLRINVPKDGGLIVLAGRNGSGKSHAIRATEALLTGRGTGAISTRDGQAVGLIEGLGARVTLGKRSRRSGELECVHLESKLDPASLVDPGIKDPEAADAKRIQALVGLAGIKPDPSLFYEVFGGKEGFDEAVSPSSLDCQDLIAMSGKVKRDAEAKARDQESRAAKASGEALAYREQIETVDMSAPCDEASLNAELETAIRKAAEIEHRDLLASQSAAARAAAQEDLDRETREYDGPSVIDATETVKSAKETLEREQQALQEAQRRVQVAKNQLDVANAALSAANRHAKTLTAASEAIRKAGVVEAPTVKEIDDAKERVAKAREAVATGQRVRDAKARQQKAERLQALSVKHLEEAARFRGAASGIEEVLSRAVQAAGVPELRVAGGRLVTTTGRGLTLYSDLSHGERWRIALDIAIRQVGKGGVLTIPQEAFEGLDPSNRDAIHRQLKQHGVVGLTAEAADGPIEAHVPEEELVGA